MAQQLYDVIAVTIRPVSLTTNIRQATPDTKKDNLEVECCNYVEIARMQLHTEMSSKEMSSKEHKPEHLRRSNPCVALRPR